MKHKLLIGILVAIALTGMSYLCGRHGRRPNFEPMPVADRQRFLQKAGFYEGRVDGICGELTHEAQLQWEKQEITIDADYWYVKMGGTK